MARTFPWERLSSADAANFTFEHPDQAYSIGIVATLDAARLLDASGTPDLGRLRSLLEPRVLALPRLRQRVHLTHWWEGWPVWVDCPPDLAAHVVGAPALRDVEDVARLAGELISEPLPRDRPLWALTVAVGPGPDAVTAVLRLHHCIADGVSGVRVMLGLFDPHPDARAAKAVVDAGPGRAPTGRELVADAAGRRARRAVAALRRARRLPAALKASGSGLSRTAVVIRGSMPATSLLGPTGAQRGVAFSTTPLATLKGVAQQSGATVNDVVLDAVAEAVTALLRHRGEPLPDILPVSVPVSLRIERAGGIDNRVGVMLVEVPLAAEDRADRLEGITRSTEAGKEWARQAGTLELTRTRLGAKILDSVSERQHTVALSVSNVPGPRQPLRLGGALLRAVTPLSIIAGNVRISVAALSYAGTLSVTTTYDRASNPDIDVFTHTLAGALAH